MLTATLLATTLYIKPVINKGGDYGIFGLKFTQKISDGIYFKVRTSVKPKDNEQPEYKIKAYFDFDF